MLIFITVDIYKHTAKKNKKIKRADQILPEVYGTTLKVFGSSSMQTKEPKQESQHRLLGHLCLREENLSFNNNYMITQSLKLNKIVLTFDLSSIFEFNNHVISHAFQQIFSLFKSYSPFYTTSSAFH